MLDGANVRYWDFAAERADSPTIVMVHGFRGDYHGLLKVISALPSARVIICDLPGFGASEPFEHWDHNVSSYELCIGRLFDELDLGPDTVLLGHSFGSIIAAHFAADYPPRVDSLVLINPICEPTLEGAKGVLSKLAELYYLLGAKLPERAGLYLLRNRLIVRAMTVLMSKTRDRTLRRWIHAEHLRYFSSFANRTVLLEAFRASINGTVRQVADRLTMPVLLIAAAQDDLGSVDGQRQLAAGIPHSQLHILDGVGHLIHYEKPEEAAALITDFLHHSTVPGGGA